MSADLYNLFPSFFVRYKASVIFSCVSSYYGMCSGITFYNHKEFPSVSTAISPHCSNNADFQVPVSHFFESKSTLMPASSLVTTIVSPAVSTLVEHDYIEFYPPTLSLSQFSDYHFSGTFFYKIFFGGSYAGLFASSSLTESAVANQTSLNILLGQKRNADYRHTHFFYLLLGKGLGSNYSNASFCCIFDFV